MYADLTIIMREIAITWEFWISMLPMIAIILITWGFVIFITILEAVKDFRNS